MTDSISTSIASLMQTYLPVYTGASSTSDATDSASTPIASLVQANMPVYTPPTPTTSDSTTSALDSAFGPDYLLSVFDSQSLQVSEGYDSSGQAILPPADSPAGLKRAAALQEAGILVAAGDTAGARAKAQTVLAANQSDSAAAYIIGRAYLKDGDYKHAEEYWSRVATAEPDNAQAQSDLRATQVLQRGEQAAVTEVKKLLSNSSTVEEGLQLAGYLIETKPKSVDARIALADYYEGQGALDQTGVILGQAVEVITGDGQDKLVARLEQLVQDHPDDASAHDLLAQGYASADRLSDAEKEFNAALDLSDDPLFQSGLKQDFAEVYSGMGHEALGRGDETAARSYFDKALQLYSSDARRTDVLDLAMKLGERALRQGVANEALLNFSKAAASLPTSGGDDLRETLIRDYTTLGNKLSAAGDLKRAVTARDGAYTLDTENGTNKRSLADAYDAYGMQLYDSGKYRDAVKQFKAALKLYDGDTTYAHHLGLAQDGL